MQTITFLLVIFTFQAQASPFDDGSSRIYNGALAGEHEFPSAVRLVTNYPNSVGYCSASLITQIHVVTAGHCVWDKDNKNVRPAEIIDGLIGNADVSNAKKIGFKTIHIHPTYDIAKAIGDIAVLETKEPVELVDPSIRTICMGSSKFPLDNLQKVTSAGWGLHAAGNLDNLLRKTDSKLISNDECYSKIRQRYQEMARCIDSETENQLCGGDSGGPLMAKAGGKYVLVGVASLSTEGKCRYGSHISICTLVTYYEKWIRGIVKDESLCVVDA